MHSLYRWVLILAGLYVGAHGTFMSEVLHLKRKFGQWQEDDGDMEHMDLEFYEYVEAYKLIGSVSVPAGQVFMFLFCLALKT